MSEQPTTICDRCGAPEMTCEGCRKLEAGAPKTTDAKARLRAQIGNRSFGTTLPVDVADLTAVLRELGELRQRCQQQEAAIRTTAEDWSKKGMSLGRLFANRAAEMYRRDCIKLRERLTAMGAADV